MTRTLLTLILSALCAAFQPAQASCTTGTWVSVHKDLHAVGNAAVTFGTNAAMKQWAPETFEAHPYLGLLPALAVSVAREEYKMHHGARCEYASMAYDAMGMAVGVAGTRWLLVPEPHGVKVAYSTTF